MNILVIAPHPDDEIIGVGGTIAKRVLAGDCVYVCVVTKGMPPLFNEGFIEQGRDECRKADKLLGVEKTIFLDYPAAMLENVPRHELNESLVNIIQSIKPDEVYIPHRGDMQIDHKMVVDAAMVALRPKYEHKVSRVYSYETLSETGWDIPNTVNDFIPNVFEDISSTFETKLNAMECFQSQLAEFPQARSIGAIEALARYRGSLVSFSAAEAFSLIREIKE
ncbi:MAG: PIG-L family deacetylase [Ruminococcus sp.]|nr:PIG-L family deacetylase [Ruminococcus sp.]